MFLVPCLFRLPHPSQGCTWSLLHAPNPPLWGHLESSHCGEQETHSCLDLSAKPLQTHSFLSLVTFSKVSIISHPQFALPATAVSPLPFYIQILLFPSRLSLEKFSPLENPKLKKFLAPAPSELLQLCSFGQEVSFPTSILALHWNSPSCTPRN